MGVSYDHTAVLHFTSEDDCELFNNYLQRNLNGGRFERTSGFDIEDNTWQTYSTNDKSPDWYLYEIFEQGYEPDMTPITFYMDIDKCTVQLDSNGYGNIPAFIISYAMKQYKADSLYMEGSGCQGQENSKWKVVHREGITESLCVPDWADM